jgi:hypothetical protein
MKTMTCVVRGKFDYIVVVEIHKSLRLVLGSGKTLSLFHFRIIS